MAERSADWLNQALRDLEQAEASMEADRHEWSSPMPPPSSSGSVLRWPSAEDVLEQAGEWARRQAEGHPEVEAVGVFGSYGRGDAGVGSDLDLVLVLSECDLPVWERLRPWDTSALPLATDLLVYSRQEWDTLPEWNPTFAATLQRDLRWLWLGQESWVEAEVVLAEDADPLRVVMPGIQ